MVGATSSKGFIVFSPFIWQTIPAIPTTARSGSAVTINIMMSQELTSRWDSEGKLFTTIWHTYYRKRTYFV